MRQPRAARERSGPRRKESQQERSQRLTGQPIDELGFCTNVYPSPSWRLGRTYFPEGRFGTARVDVGANFLLDLGVHLSLPRCQREINPAITNLRCSSRGPSAARAPAPKPDPLSAAWPSENRQRLAALGDLELLSLGHLAITTTGTVGTKMNSFSLFLRIDHCQMSAFRSPSLGKRAKSEKNGAPELIVKRSQGTGTLAPTYRA